MTRSMPFIGEILAAALEPGPEAAPEAMLAELSRVRAPVEAICDPEQRDALFAAFNSEYGFIQYALHGGELDVQTREKWIALSRWLIRELREWTLSADPHSCRLVAACIVIEACGEIPHLWDAMPASIGANAQLFAAFEVAIRSANVAVIASERALLWERDVLAAIAEADKGGDWVRIGELLPRLADVFFPATGLSVAVNALARFDFDRLLRSLSSVATTPAAVVYGRSLAPPVRLRAASASPNPHLQFCFALLTLIESPRSGALSDDDRKVLTDLLVSVATDLNRWSAWMRALNAHPARFPLLQPALGHALAAAPPAALAAYVDSIELSSGVAHGRAQVADCLRHFHAAADKTHAHQLYALAHERWLAWNFGGDSSDALLLGVSRSELDYAIVGYVFECMSEGQRAEEMHSHVAMLGLVGHTWHASKVAALSEWNRILSRFQPYAQASVVAQSGGDWLANQQVYKPATLRDRYVELRFSSR